MSKKGNVTYEKVVEAILALRNENVKINVRNVCNKIGGGDFSKISNFIQLFFENEARSEEKEINISEDLKEKIKFEIVNNLQHAREKDQRAIANLTDRCSELQELLVRSEQERVDLASALDVSRVEKATTEGAYRSELSFLRDKVEKSQKESDALHSQVSKASEELRQLAVSAALAGEEVNRLKASLVESELLQTKIAEENRQLRTENYALQKDVNASQAESKVLTLSLERTDKQLESQQEEIKQLNLRLERVSAEHSNVRETSARLETRLIEMEKNNDLERRRKKRTPATTSTMPPNHLPTPAGSV